LQMKIASTGPPPRGGGNKNSLAKDDLGIIRLQRGRPRAGAEISSQPNDKLQHRNASTGPPPRGGGN